MEVWKDHQCGILGGSCEAERRQEHRRRGCFGDVRPGDVGWRIQGDERWQWKWMWKRQPIRKRKKKVWREVRPWTLVDQPMEWIAMRPAKDVDTQYTSSMPSSVLSKSRRHGAVVHVDRSRRLDVWTLWSLGRRDAGGSALCIGDSLKGVPHPVWGRAGP